MSRELSLEILVDGGVQQIIAARRKTLVWIATKAVDYADGFEKVSSLVEDSEVVLVARAGLPSAFCRDMNKSFSGVEVAERLVRDAETLVETVSLAEEAYADENAESQAAFEAEKESAEEAELERLDKESAAKVANEVAQVEAKKDREAKAKEDADRAASEQKDAALRLQEKRAEQSKSEAAVDEKNADSPAVSSIAKSGSLTQAGLDSMPIESSGLPRGITGDLIAGRITTVGQLILLLDAEDGDISIVDGIGDKSNEKIVARVAELQAMVANSESE